MAVNITIKISIFHIFKSAAVSFAHSLFSSPSSGGGIIQSNLTVFYVGLVFHVYCFKWCSTCFKNKYNGNFHSVK